MRPRRGGAGCLRLGMGLALWAGVQVGCSAPPLRPPDSGIGPGEPAGTVRGSGADFPQGAARLLAPVPLAKAAPEVRLLPAVPLAPPSADGPELAVESVVRQVLATHPMLAQMEAAVRAAAARAPQVSALDDPMLTAWMAPATIGAAPLNYSQRVELSQKLPFPGKRGLRDQSAKALTAAAGHDLDDARLQLVESAYQAYFDDYLAERALEVNREGRERLQEFKRNAEARFKSGQAVSEQDLSQADVEIGRQDERRLALERARTVAVARLRTLMSLPPDAPLAPTPRRLDRIGPLPDAAQLRAEALAQRPDLRALADRAAAEQAALALARREFYPDVEAMAAYDSFWQSKDDEGRLRAQIGLRVNLPVQRGRRFAAVAEAEAQLAQRQAAVARQVTQIEGEVQEAYARVMESEQAIRLYEEQILPAARQNVKTAQALYVTGKAPFLNLVEAQRGLVDLQDRLYQSVADAYRRRATLERVIGAPLHLP